MADIGYKKALWKSRALRPGDSDFQPPSVSVRKPSVPGGRQAGGMSADTAPFKHETQHFDLKHGFPGSFGRTGMTGET